MLWRPDGEGPYPAVLFNHGSGEDYSDQIVALGPVFAERGYVLFWPYRRGHGLSGDQADWVGNQLDAAEEEGGSKLWSEVMTDLLQGPHLADQMAALDWLLAQPVVDNERVYVAGNSFGGIQTALVSANKPHWIHIFPAFGETSSDGHSFGYLGAAIWAETVFSFFEENAPAQGG